MRLNPIMPGAANGFSGLVRCVLDNAEQRWLHAGADEGMPLRFQIVHDWALFDPAIWNRVMAEFLLNDVCDVIEQAQGTPSKDMIDILDALQGFLSAQEI